jgi:hypothetical protein
MLEQIWEAIQPQVIDIITTLLLLFVSYVGVKIKALYESKVKNEQVKDIIEKIVMYVEQKGKELTSSEKYDVALSKASEWLGEKHIKMSETELEILIESAVQNLYGKEEK